ncbi:MAG: M48 family metalloprotease [Alphaproteobacteria bacterium]|nr:M48 family metalloprotease [Alphaproteobacteria bacterium]
MMITFARFGLLIGMLAFSCLFIGAFLFALNLIWGTITGDQNMTQESLLYVGLLWTIAIMVTLTILSGTFLGDKFAALCFPTRKMSLREEEKINPALDELKTLYKNKHKENLDIRPTVLDVPNINGMAYGQKTIAVSTGLLKVAEDEEITAVLAHEIGHLHHKDGFFNLALFTASYPTYFLHYLFKQIFMILPKPTSLPSDMWDVIWLLKTFVFFFVMIAMAPFIILWLISFPVIWVFNALETTVQWPIEYRADKFAADMGYGPALISLLERIEDEDVRAETGFLVKYFHTHPPTALRIDALERGFQV